MAEVNTTLPRYTRSASSPELWVPYVMIGVSCVTFLAVHFWCYHKRNRERYLRKRDEKRVKSGLLERRRITTLMLARYQSDLGVSNNETDIDHSHDCLFYDNAADVTFDETDSTNSSSRQGEHVKKNHAIYHLAPLGNPEETGATATNAITAPTVPLTTTTTTTIATTADTTTTGSTLPSSQTWPLASERKVTCYNAHLGKRKSQDKADGGNEHHETYIRDQTVLPSSSRAPGLGSKDNRQTRPVSHTVDTDQRKHKTDCGSKAHQAFSQPDSYSKETSCGESYIRQLPHPSPSYGQRSSPSPPAYQDVVYTQLTSSYPQMRSPSPIFAHFNLKHKKRRHDGVPVQSSTSSPKHRDLPWGKGCRDMSRLFDDQSGTTNPYTITGRASRDGAFLFNDSHEYGIIDQHTANHSFPFRLNQDEALPFAEMGHEYGTMSSETNNQNIQVIPLREMAHTSSRPNFSLADPHGGPSNNLDRGPRGTVYVVNSESLHELESNIDSDARDLRSDPLSNTLPRYRSDHCFVRSQNVVIPLPERSHFNVISRTPGKIRAEALDNLSTIWGQKTKTAPLTRMESLDNYSNFGSNIDPPSKGQKHDSVQSQHGHSELSPEINQSDTGNNQLSPLDNMPGYHIHTADITDHNPSNDTHKAGPSGEPPIAAQPELQTPSLRDLNPRLVFQHCKRKLTVSNSQ